MKHQAGNSLVIFSGYILTINVLSLVFKVGFISCDNSQYVFKNENIKSIDNIWKICDGAN
jgi:hypothetical protein